MLRGSFQNLSEKVDDEERLEEDDGDEGGDDEERQEEEGDDEGGGEGEDEDDDDDEDDDERDDDDGDRSGYDDSVDDDSEGDGEEVKEDDDNEYGDDDEEYGDDDAEYGDDDTEDNSNSVEEGNDDEEGDDDDELDDDEKEDSDEEQSDAGQEDDDQEQEEPGASDGSFSSIQVLTPSEGQVLMPESSYEVRGRRDELRITREQATVNLLLYRMFPRNLYAVNCPCEIVGPHAAAGLGIPHYCFFRGNIISPSPWERNDQEAGEQLCLSNHHAEPPTLSSTVVPPLPFLCLRSFSPSTPNTATQV